MAPWIGILLVLVGLVVTVWGVGRASLYRTITGTPTSSVLDVDGPGRVELEGTARPTDGRTTEGPLTGREALATGWRVEEWDERGDNAHWNEVAEGYDSVPFELDDGSASIRVDPGSDASASGFVDALDMGDLSHSVGVGETTVDFRTLETVDQIPPDGAKPGRIARFEQTEPTVDEHTGSITNVVDVGKKHGERRYHEGRIEPGEEVYLLGTVRAQDDGVGAGGHFRRSNAEAAAAADEPFLLSERDQSALRSATRLGFVGVVAGLSMVVAGGYVLFG
jgi:hypothetical protein